MRKAFWLCLLVMSTAAHATSDSINIGIRPDGTQVTVRKHFFGKRIERFDLVPGKPQLCVKFVETQPPLSQDLGLYDVLRQRMIWMMEMDFNEDSYLCTAQGIVVQSGKETSLLDDEGNMAWQIKKFIPIHADTRSNIVMGYPKANSNKLIGINLRDGQEVWTGTLPQNSGWGEVMSTDDDRLLIVAGQLCLLQPHSGMMKTLDINNGNMLGIQGGGAAAAVAVGGTILGTAMLFLTGTGFVTIPQATKKNAHGRLNSNLLVEDNCIYFADRSNLWRLNRQLEVVWKQKLPKRASMSHLSVAGDTLVFENLGTGMTETQKLVHDSKPYRALFSCQTGEELLMEKLKASSNDEDEDVPVACFVLNDDEKSFTPKTLLLNDLGKQEKARIFLIDRELPYGLLSVRNGYNYWIVEDDGTPRLKLTQPLMQTEVIGNTLIGLNFANVIFQLDLADL
ncbi:MAG: PQQ-like beta-propeller repeat protein [Bacteroidaceae bacterium]|nr:PQQ-like beta-propeller repeat protein [Bacteroidaceae bacterium]